MPISVTTPTAEQIDTAKAWPIWTHDVATFPWEYATSETCLIVEGRATVVAADCSDEASFGSGDMVVFPAGLKCTWTIHEHIRKHYAFG